VQWRLTLRHCSGLAEARHAVLLDLPHEALVFELQTGQRQELDHSPIDVV
jgi:hypothetical protein